MKRSILLLVIILVIPSLAPGVSIAGDEGSLMIKESQDNAASVDDIIPENSAFEVETFDFEGNATLFTSPDSAMDSLEYFLEDVNSSLDVGIYLFNHPGIAKRIANLSQNGISVRVLIEGVPVHGLSEGSISCLDLIAREGGEIRTMGGDAEDTYTYHHPKYMIKDNYSVMFTSENLVYPGFPTDRTYGNRGWGIILESEDLASYYLDVYEHDWRLGENHQDTGSSIKEFEYGSGLYSSSFERTEINSDFKVTPVLSPDTSMSEKTILDMIRSAENNIYVQQYYVRHWEEEKNPYLEAIKDAAERGVRVKMMLDSTWYHLGENGNDQMIEEINEFAERNDVEMEARLLSSYKDLLKSHNKGMIVDGNQTLISSINWNENSVLQNREAGVIVENDLVGEYYSEIFLDDWRDDIVPIADASQDRIAALGEEITLTGENSWDDHGVVSYRWDTDGDGTYDKKGVEIALTFEEEGTHRVELLIEDVGGNTARDEVFIHVEEKDETFQIQFLNWIILFSPAVAIMLLLIRSIYFSRS